MNEMYGAPQDQQKKEPKNISDMSKEELQDYLQQGTYGMQKLYHDTGAPDKADQYGNIQGDIQDVVYAGNARLLDIQDRSQLKKAAQKTRAILAEYENVGEDDEALDKFTANVARIGGPDLSKYDRDIRRQGFELWGKTFNEQMAQIVSSPRGRELYGDVVTDSFDMEKNEPHRQLKKEQFISSEAGMRGTSFANAIKAKGIDRLYEVGHWSNPKLSESPDMVQGQDKEEEVQPKSKPPIYEQQSLINEIKDKTSTPDFDVEYLHRVGTELSENYNQKIDFSSPNKLWASVSRSVRALDSHNLNFGAGEGKYIPTADAAKNVEKNKLDQSRIEAYAEYAEAPDEQKEAMAQRVNQATQNLHTFNIRNLPETDQKSHTTRTEQYDKELMMIQKQEAALGNALVAMVNLDPRELGAMGGVTDDLKDFVHEFVLGRGKQIEPGSATREEVDFWLDQFKFATMQNEGGSRLMDKFGNSLRNADLGAIKSIYEATAESSAAMQDDHERYMFYVGEKGTVSGAPTRQSYSEKVSTRVADVLKPLNKQANMTADGETLEQVTRKQNNVKPLSGGFDLEEAKAEAARRGL